MSTELESLIQALEQQIIVGLLQLDQQEKTIIPTDQVDWIQRAKHKLDKSVTSLFPHNPDITASIQKINVFEGANLLQQAKLEIEIRDKEIRKAITKNDYRIIIGHFRDIVSILKEQSANTVLSN